MSGRAVGIFLVLAGLLAGGFLYWTQVYAYYERLPAEEVVLTVTLDGSERELTATDVEAIDSDSSPIRFRACFRVTDAIIGDSYADAMPLNAPAWFDCFDSAQLGSDLEGGKANAFLGQENVEYGIDRVIAVYDDGRAYAWHQINACGEAVFDGKPAPSECPLVPEGGS